MSGPRHWRNHVCEEETRKRLLFTLRALAANSRGWPSVQPSKCLADAEAIVDPSRKWEDLSLGAVGMAEPA
jgi:hypothetical protein